MTFRSVWLLAITSALAPLAANFARASDLLPFPSLSLDPRDNPKLQTPAPDAATPKPIDPSVLTLDAGGTASRIHGFGDFRIDSQYITPRGLLAEKKSPQFQALTGLVFNLYQGDGFIKSFSVDGGLWADFNSKPDLSVVTGGDTVTEVDVFAGFGMKFEGGFALDYTIQAWTFPDLTSGHNEIDPTTEYNMDWKFSYDDTAILKDWALHPYVDVFWNFTGKDSPVVAQSLLGKNDHTFYVEMGIGPSYTLKAIPDLPITFTLPAYFSVGDSSFWGQSPGGNRSNFGVATIGLKASVPISWIPKDFGSWNAYVGVTYFHTCNPALTSINSPAADSNMVLGYAGIGYGF